MSLSTLSWLSTAPVLTQPWHWQPGPRVFPFFYSYTDCCGNLLYLLCAKIVLRKWRVIKRRTQREERGETQRVGELPGGRRGVGREGERTPLPHLHTNSEEKIRSVCFSFMTFEWQLVFGCRKVVKAEKDILLCESLWQFYSILTQYYRQGFFCLYATISALFKLCTFLCEPINACYSLALARNAYACLLLYCCAWLSYVQYRCK